MIYNPNHTVHVINHLLTDIDDYTLIKSIYIDPYYGFKAKQLTNGLIIFSLIEYFFPNVINWNDIELICNNTFQSLSNCQKIINYLQQTISIRVIGLTAELMYKNSFKIWASILFQMMRYSMGISDDILLLNWLNSFNNNKVINKPLHNFHQINQIIQLILYIIDLYTSLVDWQYVTNNELNDNVKYSVSLAIKIGCNVFYKYHSVLNNPKIRKLFIASIKNKFTLKS